MSGDIESLCEPITAEAPCGADLEDTPLLASFDAFRVFGSSVPLPSDIDWRALRERSFGALEQSRDIRLLAHLAAAAVRIDGLPALCSVLIVADRWLSERWESVFPRVEEDAILRKNALNCFADRMAVVDALRRAPISAHRQLGAFSLRDLELASGQLAPSETDTNVPNSAQIEATLAGSALEDLAKLSARVTGATAALRNIVATMQTRAGFESAPDLDAALKPLSRIETLLSEHVRSRAPAEGAAAGADGQSGAEAAEGPSRPGEIRSRQDAIRAIEASAAFFRKHEPSSPVPLFLERAKRLISKSFLEVLEDIAPDSLSQAKLVGGVKSDEGQ